MGDESQSSRDARLWGRRWSALAASVCMLLWSLGLIEYSMAYDTGVDGPQLFGMFVMGVGMALPTGGLIGYGLAPMIYAKVARAGWRRYWHGVLAHVAIVCWMYAVLLAIELLSEAGVSRPMLALATPLAIPIVTAPLWLPASLAGTLVYGFVTAPTGAARIHGNGESLAGA